MPNTYELMAIHIDTSTGVAKPSLNFRVTDSITGVTSGLDKQISPVPPAAQTQLDALVTSALSFINSKYPGANITLPPVAP